MYFVKFTVVFTLMQWIAVSLGKAHLNQAAPIVAFMAAPNVVEGSAHSVRRAGICCRPE